MTESSKPSPGPQGSGPKPKPFNARAFWSLLAALTLLGLPWSGIELHLHQADPASVERHAWMAAHWTLATLFTIAVIAHAWWDDEVGMLSVSYMGWATKAPAGVRDPTPVREA